MLRQGCRGIPRNSLEVAGESPEIPTGMNEVRT